MLIVGDLERLAGLHERFGIVEAKQDRILELLEKQAATSAAPVPLQQWCDDNVVSLSTGRRMVRDGRLPIIRVGRLVRVDVARLKRESIAEQAAAARRGER